MTDLSTARLLEIVRRAEDGAGTLAANLSVKVRPADWHTLTAAAREVAPLIDAHIAMTEALDEQSEHPAQERSKTPSPGHFYMSNTAPPEDVDDLAWQALKLCKQRAKAMRDALEAWERADAAQEGYDEILERTIAEDWINDPTGSMHVNSVSNHAHEAMAHARNLRKAALNPKEPKNG